MNGKEKINKAKGRFPTNRERGIYNREHEMAMKFNNYFVSPQSSFQNIPENYVFCENQELKNTYL